MNHAASATGFLPSLAKTRVGGPRVIAPTRTGASSDLSATTRWGCGLCSYDSASARLDDGIYRLTQETISLDPHSNNGSVAYILDPVGNRLSQNSTLSAIVGGSFTYDANDRLSTETYDNNGNTLVSGARTFTYDFENRLKSMNNGAVTATIVYDGDGRRVAKMAGGVTTRYLIDDLNPTGYAQVVEELIGAAVQRTYTYGQERISQSQLVNSTWTPSFYGYDGGGSVRALTDASAAVTDTYDYDAWGNAINTVGSTSNAYLYRGEQYDADLRLYYLRARYFNPLSGRFLTRDPYKGRTKDPATLHKYLYTGTDPVNKLDRSGRAETMEYTLGVVVILTAMTVSELQHEAQTHAAGNLFGAVGSGINLNWINNGIALGGAYFASKADLRQFSDAGKSVGKEQGCRPPTPDDFEIVHEIIADMKGPDGKVTWEQLLEAWRDVLCGGGE